MTVRTILLFVSTFALLAIGCGQQESQPARKTKAAPTPFVSTSETIQGEWYVVATNPRIAGRIITDYISVGFRPDGTVIRTTRSGGKVEIQEGQYTWNAAKKQTDAKFDLGESGIQVWTFGAKPSPQDPLKLSRTYRPAL